MPLALALARHVPAFAAPGRETRVARRLHKLLAKPPQRRTVSVSVHDGELFALLEYACSAPGRAAAPQLFRQLVAWLYSFATGEDLPRPVPVEWTSHTVGVYDLSLSSEPTRVVALLTFRPQPLLPLSLASARRAVTFVHGFIALVTANAYISTLGGGHFLCLHLAQAKLMARLQIAIADALFDPVLKSKCRVNLAYNAMREGRFRHAKRLIHQEEAVAVALENEELVKICEAAQVYLAKTVKLHQEFLRQRADLTARERAVVDNFYRQRILRKAH